MAFASFFVYNPRKLAGEGAASEGSRRLVRSVKSETRQWFRRWEVAENLRDRLPPAVRVRFLGGEATLVPMPGHAPRKERSARWGARDICEEFERVGLGSTWLPLLERVHRVNKAAFSAPHDRPTVEQHYESMRAHHHFDAGKRITVIDDVITRGATMLAAVGLLRSAFPGAEVRGFALVRTVSDVPIARVIDPVEGMVHLAGRGTHRTP